MTIDWREWKGSRVGESEIQALARDAERELRGDASKKSVSRVSGNVLVTAERGVGGLVKVFEAEIKRAGESDPEARRKSTWAGAPSVRGSGRNGVHVARFPQTGQPRTSPMYPGEGPTVLIQYQGQDYVEIPENVVADLISDLIFVTGNLSDLVFVAGKTSGAARIAAERKRQVAEKGFDVKHDGEHGLDELLWAAAHLVALGMEAPARSELLRVNYNASGFEAREPWPEGWEPPKHAKAAPSSTGAERCLEKAGALIAAEIDRRRARAALAAEIASGGKAAPVTA